ncbi:hypothetical protein [Candidatus Macondimonas diazotrophica]|jgi:hypothetical protein|uniref:Uncharacterized protein n=1 Tax=Candidatus Macondimonas diazotrophica TaxID=2305248 RepID=A0A4Z0FE16_9GAMM|nr:hypothetical protein [Candidatus Macondimonas diazotrophica]NCU02092.1 hypothetical protein [Candidatus Macondimonas diazotrophica]TFZ84000.1 hypothetical protein E4680_00165 [Candidatus Macondimonas diazotrophica]
MQQAARTVGKWLGQFRKPNHRSSRLKAAKPVCASDIILGMTLVMLAIVLVIWLLAQLFTGSEQAGIDIEYQRWSLL